MPPPDERPRTRPFPKTDRVPPVPSTPRTEFHGINRSLDDLPPAERTSESARQGKIVGPLVAVALVIIAMLAIAGWLLIGWPSSR